MVLCLETHLQVVTLVYLQMRMLELVRQSQLHLLIVVQMSGNYSVTDQSSTTADISTKALTATASAV